MSIHRLARRRPTPALILACLALFVALGGTSYAVATGSIGSSQIRDGSVRSIDVKDHGLRGLDLARDTVDGEAIDEATLDVSKLDLPEAEPPRGDVTLRVRVDPQGRESLARGVEDVDHLFTGYYDVTFDRDVSQCVAVATVLDDMAGPGEIRIRQNDGSERTVAVATTNSAGTPTDQGFHLIVSC